MTDRVTRANLTIRRYRTYRRNFAVLDENGAIADLAGYTGRVQFRTAVAATPFFDGGTDDGALQIDVASGVVALEIPYDDTGAFTADTAQWDIELIDSADRRIPLVEGYATIIDVTTRT